MPETRSILIVASSTGGENALVTQALAGEAFAVACVERPQALVTLDEGAADVVVVDAESDFDGALDLLRGVLERWPGMPVVVLTDDVPAARVAEAVALGASDLLLRPFGGK